MGSSSASRPSNESGPVPPAQSADELAGALVRLFSIAPLYPSDHQRFGQVVDPLLERLGEVPSPLTIQVGDKGLGIRSTVLSAESGSAARLRSDLDALGIVRLEIDRAATAEDLHALAGHLREGLRRRASSAGFQRVELEGLPRTIRAFQREFGRRVHDPTFQVRSAEALRAAVERALAPLQGEGAGDAVSQACSEHARRLFTNVIERLDARQGPASQGGGKLERPLEQVLEIGAEAVRRALERELAREAGARDVARLLDVVEQAIALSEDKDSARILVDVLHDADGAAREEGVPSREEEFDGRGFSSPVQGGFELSLEELRERIQALSAADNSIRGVEREDRAERLSILLELLLDYPAPAVLAAIGRELRDALALAFASRERELVCDAVRELCARADFALVDRSLPLITAPLRALRADGAAELLLEVARSRTQDMLQSLWPHLAAELFLGCESARAAVESELIESLARLDPELLPAATQRLGRLGVLGSKRLSKRVFQELRPELFPLLGELLSSPNASTIGPALLRALQFHPPPWPGSQALQCLTSWDSKAQRFVARIVREKALVQASPELRDEAAAILLEALPRLPRTQRGVPWLPAAIRALGELGRVAAVPVLTSVRSDRRRIVLRAWPAACRREASVALAKLESTHDAGQGRVSADPR